MNANSDNVNLKAALEYAKVEALSSLSVQALMAMLSYDDVDYHADDHLNKDHSSGDDHNITPPTAP